MLVPYREAGKGRRVLGGLKGKVRFQIDEKNWKLSDEELLRS
jgi:hypothetical protein